MEELLIVFAILLVLLILISTFGGAATVSQAPFVKPSAPATALTTTSATADEGFFNSGAETEEFNGHAEEEEEEEFNGQQAHEDANEEEEEEFNGQQDDDVEGYEVTTGIPEEPETVEPFEGDAWASAYAS